LQVIGQQGLGGRVDLHAHGQQFAAQIIADLGVRRMQVFGAPKRLHALDGFGLEITGYVVPEDEPQQQ